MNAEDRLNALIQGLSPEKRECLQHVFVHLVHVIANEKLEGFFIHTLPSPDESEIEPVLMHAINCGVETVEEMMCNFLAARSAQAAAASNTDPTRTH